MTKKGLFSQVQDGVCQIIAEKPAFEVRKQFLSFSIEFNDAA